MFSHIITFFFLLKNKANNGKQIDINRLMAGSASLPSVELWRRFQQLFYLYLILIVAIEKIYLFQLQISSKNWFYFEDLKFHLFTTIWINTIHKKSWLLLQPCYKQQVGTKFLEVINKNCHSFIPIKLLCIILF